MHMLCSQRPSKKRENSLSSIRDTAVILYFRYPGKECWTTHSTVLSNMIEAFILSPGSLPADRRMFQRVCVRWSQVYQCWEWHKPVTWAAFVNERLTSALILIYNRNLNIFSLHLSRCPFCLGALASASTFVCCWDQNTNTPADYCTIEKIGD